MSKQLDKLKATMQRIEAQKAELDQKIKAQAPMKTSSCS